VADAKSRPGVITVANSGVGSHTHIVSTALFNAAGVQVVEVPYGAAQVVPSLLGGHVDAMVQLPAALSAHLKSGSIRVLAALIPSRDPALPEVPTAREQGVDVALEAWRGIAAPKGTPKPVISMLEGAIRQTVATSEYAKASADLGVRPAYLPAAEFGELIAKEDGELATLMRMIGIEKPAK